MFMWRWQHRFQTEIASLLTDIFQILELPLVFNIFIMGIPRNNQPAESICFQPEACGFTPQEFQEVLAIAKDNFDRDPEQFFFRETAHLNQVHKDSLYPKAVRKAIQSILQKYDIQRQQVSFCSFPIPKNNRWITTIIQLQQQDFEHHYRLTKATHEVNSMRSYRIERCFLEALIYQVLSASELELQRASAVNTSSLGNPERIIEDAASSLLNSIELHINQWNKIDLLSFANAIAAERYEGTASEGRLIICPQNHPDIAAKIKLQTPIKIYNYRGIRKLLEVSSSKMALLCDIESVWGLGIPLDTYQPSLENLFEIRFAEYHTWELFHADNIMLRVKYRQPRLPRARFDRGLFCDRVSKMFNINQATAKILIVAVEAAVAQRHGTMLVITPEAAAETKRLAAQCTVIEPVIVSRDIISHLSSVDGAILISPAGIVHSFGVILDGRASENGNPTRGARYNSAIRYIDGKLRHKINCLALIVSEDGYVDLYPNLSRSN